MVKIEVLDTLSFMFNFPFLIVFEMYCIVLPLVALVNTIKTKGKTKALISRDKQDNHSKDGLTSKSNGLFLLKKKWKILG